MSKAPQIEDAAVGCLVDHGEHGVEVGHGVELWAGPSGEAQRLKAAVEFCDKEPACSFVVRMRRVAGCKRAPLGRLVAEFMGGQPQSGSHRGPNHDVYSRIIAQAVCGGCELFHVVLMGLVRLSIGDDLAEFGSPSPRKFGWGTHVIEPSCDCDLRYTVDGGAVNA